MNRDAPHLLSPTMRADPRPARAASMVAMMGQQIPARLLKSLPPLLARLLCDRDAAPDLDQNRRVAPLPRVLFAPGYGAVRAVDAVVRSVVPGLSITRALMDRNRTLRLPQATRDGIRASTPAPSSSTGPGGP